MPAARGLFHRAIIQSGAAIRVSTRERANALAEAVLKELGLGRDECERLQAVPAERLLATMAPASRAVGRTQWPLLDRYDFGPVVDGNDLPQHPSEPHAPAIADDIPLMIGGTKEESAFFLADDDAVWNGTLTEEELRERVAAVAGAETDNLLGAYRRAMPQSSPGDRLIAALTGSNFWIRTVLLAERYAARQRAPVYVYSLNWQSPAHGGRLKAHHAMDVPFVFDNVDLADTTAGAPSAAEMAARISATWIAFARYGKPDNPAIPLWPLYTIQQRATMILDTTCGVVHDPDREMRLLWTRMVGGNA
jgi:para-nitrobenzyl esterase